MIPYNIISKEPTAELKFNQKDSDSLPPYEILDQILEMLIDENKDLQSIINKGFKKGLVVKVWKMIKNSEFKRYQSAIGPKLTKMSLANDRRFQLLTSLKYYERLNVKIRSKPYWLLHVGNLRVALLNYLFAKKHNKKFF